MPNPKLIILILLSGFPWAGMAVEKLEVQGLFANKAVLMIDGNRHVLAVGETSPEGVRVIAANSKSATLEVDGKQQQYLLGNTITTSYAKPETVKEQIFADQNGMFLTYGSINGHSVRFIVDTGATSIAMNANDARRLGIQYRLDGIPARTSTASGVARGWRVKLRSVKVGRLKQSNVEAMVIDGAHPTEVLLGMTFLDRLKVQKENGVMVLEQKK
jgi:aspartyl protease family protein